MTLYVNGYRWLPMDPFDETLDDYSLKKQLKERAMGMWSDIEGNLKKAHKNLGLPSKPSAKRYVEAAVLDIRRAIEEHVPICPNAGTWVGKQGAATRVEDN